MWQQAQPIGSCTGKGKETSSSAKCQPLPPFVTAAPHSTSCRHKRHRTCLQQRKVAHDGQVVLVHAQRVLVALDGLVVLAVRAVQQAAAGVKQQAWSS